MTFGKRLSTLLLPVLLVIAGWGTSVQAQSTHLTPKNLGLGSGGTAYIDGYHANFINPANLMLGGEDSPRITVGLLGGLSTSAGGPLANIGVYNEYFTQGITVTGDVADEALNQWFGSNASKLKRFGMQTDIIPFGVSYRGDKWATSVALRSRVLMNVGVNKGFAQLGLMGFESEIFSNGQPVNFSAEAVTFHEASVGFSYQVAEFESLFGFAKNVKIYAGGAPKLILGASASKVDFNSVLTLKGAGPNDIDEIRHQFEYSLSTTGELSNQLQEYYEANQNQDEVPSLSNYVDPKPGDFYGVSATGVGIDLGGTVEMDLNVPGIGNAFEGPEHLKIGLSITDLGGVSFSENAGRFSAEDELVWRGFDFDEQRIKEEFNGDRNEYINHVLQDSIANEIYGSFAPEDNPQVKQTLPALISLGGQLTLNDLSISLDLKRGFNYKGTNSKRVALSTGVEYDLFGVLPFRVGMRTGGYSSTSYSAGFGFEFTNFEFSFAASTVPNSMKNGTNFGFAWSGLVLRF